MLLLIVQRLNQSKFVDLYSILWYAITQVHNLMCVRGKRLWQKETW